MTSHELLLLTAGTLFGAYLMLLAFILGGVRDDRRLTPVPVRSRR